TLPVANGGTGAATLATNNVLLGNGTSALQAVAPGTSGNVLTSNGSTWDSAASVTNWAVPGTIGSTTPNSGAFTTLTASGNVGIGTTAPVTNLDVAGTIRASGRLTILASDSSNTWNLDNTTGYLRIFREDVNGSNGSVKMAILNNGNVGIGTTNPAQMLSVAGTIESTSGGIKYPDTSVQNTAFIGRMVPGGRLTLTSNTPISTSDVTTASTLYYTPYTDDQIALYDGSNWRQYTFAQLALTLSGLTYGKNYDVFVYSNSGTPALELSAAWTNDTSRADVISRINGVWSKTTATTRRYVGTIRTTGTMTTEDSNAKRYVWNMYNRVTTPSYQLDNTAGWAVSATNTWEPFNSGNGNWKHEFVLGLSEDAVSCSLTVLILQSTTSGMFASIGVDANNAQAGGVGRIYSQSGISVYGSGTVVYQNWLPAGYHYCQAIELSGSPANSTVYGQGYSSFNSIDRR
ncbi:MAG: hypothetical protein NTY08_19165, partial [Proteobacteria bacterium]|nr:hypothetical protein [Pseudomonadota bacterium]